MDATDVYWINFDQMLKIPKIGGTSEVVGPLLGPMTADAAPIYSFTALWLMRIPFDGSAGVALAQELAADAFEVRDVAVDATSVYWTVTSGGMGKLMRVTPK